MELSRRNSLIFSIIFASAAAGCSAAQGEPFENGSDTPDAGARANTSRSDAGSAKPNAGDGGGSSSSDAGESGDAGASDAAVITGPTPPTADECLDDWALYDGGCAAPVITDSYVGNDCVGTTGWFIDGNNFQLRQHNTGIADYGPQSFGANGNQMNWNIITPTQLCVTVSAGAAYAWVGHTIYVVNPDGKSSNSVVVTDKL